MLIYECGGGGGFGSLDKLPLNEGNCLPNALSFRGVMIPFFAGIGIIDI